MIDDHAFNGCKSLAEIKLPDGVVSIGQGAFQDCTNLSRITIPDGVTAPGYPYCHVENDELRRFDNPEKAVFDGCTKLRFVTYKGKTYDRENLAELYKAINVRE